MDVSVIIPSLNAPTLARALAALATQSEPPAEVIVVGRDEAGALAAFPHEGLFDLQFFNLLEGAWNLSIDNWSKDLTPIAGSIRTTASFLSKQKALSQTAYILESKVGQGSLLITTLALRSHLDDAYPEAIALFDSILRYTTGPGFRPQSELTEDRLNRLASR